MNHGYFCHSMVMSTAMIQIWIFFFAKLRLCMLFLVATVVAGGAHISSMKFPSHLKLARLTKSHLNPKIREFCIAYPDYTVTETWPKSREGESRRITRPPQTYPIELELLQRHRASRSRNIQGCAYKWAPGLVNPAVVYHFYLNLPQILATWGLIFSPVYPFFRPFSIEHE